MPLTLSARLARYHAAGRRRLTGAQRRRAAHKARTDPAQVTAIWAAAHGWPVGGPPWARALADALARQPAAFAEMRRVFYDVRPVLAAAGSYGRGSGRPDHGHMGRWPNCALPPYSAHVTAHGDGANTVTYGGTGLGGQGGAGGVSAGGNGRMGGHHADYVIFDEEYIAAADLAGHAGAWEAAEWVDAATWEPWMAGL